MTTLAVSATVAARPDTGIHIYGLHSDTATMTSSSSDSPSVDGLVERGG
jgi:hypothetical protein